MGYGILIVGKGCSFYISIDDNYVVRLDGGFGWERKRFRDWGVVFCVDKLLTGDVCVDLIVTVFGF